jgi:phosphohistidine phosphatase
MIVTILRHGEAGSASIDAERELTPQGIDDIGFAGQQFHSACEARQLASPDLIRHSGWLRTTETADIFAGAWPSCLSLPAQALQPDGDVFGVTILLQGLQDTHPDAAHVLLVSHQPLVSQLADYYLGVANSVPALSPGGLFSFNMDVPACNGGSLLFWALPPEYQAGI